MSQPITTAAAGEKNPDYAKNLQDFYVSFK